MTANMEALKNRDYVLVIDKSLSMETKDCATPIGGVQSRWEAIKEVTKGLASRISEYDPDGITVIPFATSHKVHPNTTPSVVDNLFQEHSPGGSTYLSPVLKTVFADYQKRKAAGATKPNGEMLIVITDGAAEDKDQVAAEIVRFGNTLPNRDEYGITFLQIGKDSAAAAFLSKLDDDLVKQGAKNDIVDSKTMEDVERLGLTETLLAALTD